MMDRSQRYANPPKAPKKNGSASGEIDEAKRDAEKTAGSPPDMSDAGKVGKMDSDPGPEGGHDQTFGVVAERHKREHGDMLKRHMAEHTGHQEAHTAMMTRQHKESSDMLKRHQEEMKTEFQGGDHGGDEIKSGGDEGPKLGSEKSEGTKGTEP